MEYHCISADCHVDLCWLPHDLLLKADRCLMAHAVEGRTPFLDKGVAAAAFRLPDGMKVRDGVGKWILRKWLEKNGYITSVRKGVYRGMSR